MPKRYIPLREINFSAQVIPRASARIAFAASYAMSDALN